MKTSKKIIITVAGIILILLIITIMLLRNGVQSLQLKEELKLNYKAVSFGNFDKLDFSSHYIVRINQGKECKVEMAVEGDSIMKPRLENVHGTLYFKVDSTLEKADTGSIHVKITMPSIRLIKAVQGTKIQLDYFQSDSIRVVLEDGCSFTGNNNTIKHVSFKTSGDNQVQIIKTF